MLAIQPTLILMAFRCVSPSLCVYVCVRYTHFWPIASEYRTWFHIHRCACVYFFTSRQKSISYQNSSFYFCLSNFPLNIINHTLEFVYQCDANDQIWTSDARVSTALMVNTYGICPYIMHVLYIFDRLTIKRSML